MHLVNVHFLGHASIRLSFHERITTACTCVALDQFSCKLVLGVKQVDPNGISTGVNLHHHIRALLIADAEQIASLAIGTFGDEFYTCSSCGMCEDDCWSTIREHLEVNPRGITCH